MEPWVAFLWSRLVVLEEGSEPGVKTIVSEEQGRRQWFLGHGCYGRTRRGAAGCPVVLLVADICLENCSTTALMRSGCPSASGWNAV